MQVRLVRSGLVESFHSVAVSVVGIDGQSLLSSGDVDRSFFIRSSAKPFQAAVITELTAPWEVEQLAVICASHEALPVHVGLVQSVLRRSGLDEDALSTPPAWPGSSSARAAAIRAGEPEPRPIWHNCSGKHAGMLAACVEQGWPVAGYTDPDHPLQRSITELMVSALGRGALPVGVDGCGAPVFRCTTATAASAFLRLLTDDRYDATRTGMQRYPVLTSGPGLVDAEIATWLGVVAKRGAEGCLGVALPDRGAVFIKVWDGSLRAVGAAAFSVLDQLGWIPLGPRKQLESRLVPPVLGGGGTVGRLDGVIEMEHL